MDDFFSGSEKKIFSYKELGTWNSADESLAFIAQRLLVRLQKF